MDTLAIIKRIEMRLSEIGMSKAEFYKQSGISSASFSQWRTGTYKPTEKKLSSAAICLGVSLNYLISGQVIDEQLSLSNGICVFRSFDPNKIDSMLADFFKPNSYRIAYRAPGIVITVDNDATATDADVEQIVSEYRTSLSKPGRPVDEGYKIFPLSKDGLTERESRILEALRAKTPAEQQALLTLLGISED